MGRILSGEEVKALCDLFEGTHLKPMQANSTKSAPTPHVYDDILTFQNKPDDIFNTFDLDKACFHHSCVNVFVPSKTFTSSDSYFHYRILLMMMMMMIIVLGRISFEWKRRKAIV